jgi:hypothetical protein
MSVAPLALKDKHTPISSNSSISSIGSNDFPLRVPLMEVKKPPTRNLKYGPHDQGANLGRLEQIKEDAVSLISGKDDYSVIKAKKHPYPDMTPEKIPASFTALGLAPITHGFLRSDGKVYNAKTDNWVKPASLKSYDKKHPR